MLEIMCITCLSRDRILVSLDKTKYGSLFGSGSMITSLEAVCWECAAMFHKVHKFKLRVLKAQEYLKTSAKITSLVSLSHLTISSIDLSDICCDQSIQSDDAQKCSKTIKIDPVQNIKSENYFEEEEHNVFAKKCFFTINGVNTEDQISSINVDVTRIKNEDDNVLSDNDNLDEICVSTLETVKPVRRKRFKTVDLKREMKKAKNENITKRESRKDINKLSVTKKNYIVIEMTEEEMLAKREADRQADRYKNKVKYRCELCISGFFHQELYDKHIRIRHSEKAGKHECVICQTRFSNVNLYREHLEGHYSKYRCKECSYVGYTLSSMVAHDAKEHGVKRFSCKLCHEEFSLRSRLRFHRETMHEAPVKCESCGKMFRTKDSLRIHVKQMHSYTPKAACTVCGARVRNMKSHSRTHEAAPEAAYCAECDQRFTSTASYKSHLKYSARHRAPDTVLSHVCAVCEARFATGAGLKKHALRRHSTVRKHKCDRCGKGFEEKCKLKQHILYAHEGVEKPKDKICHICGRGFTTKLTLSNHIRVHTGEKPFRCDICSAAFSQKSSLTTHTRGVHLKLKPRPGRGHRV